MTDCLIGIGSNLGDRQRILDDAVEELGRHFKVLGKSRWYRYPSVGPVDGETDQPEFLNGAVLVASTISAQETAHILHAIEALAGRQRILRWASRTLDIDLLLFGDQQICTPDLMVPHPRMVSRRFVLEPAADVAPQMVHPENGWTIQSLLDHLVKPHPYFAVVGEDRNRAAWITKRLGDTYDGAVVFLLDAYPEAVDPAWLAEPSASPPSTNASELLGYLTGKMKALEQGNGPWFSNFWIGEFPCSQRILARDAALQPKALLVLDPPNSAFVKKLRTANSQIPMVFLSADDKDAIQDALGVVQGMRIDP